MSEEIQRRGRNREQGENRATRAWILKSVALHSPISCEVLGIGDNHARDDCESRRKLEFKDDDDFFNTDVPTKEEGEQYVLHNSLDATSDINLLHSQIPHEAIPKVDMKFKTEEAAI
ncbi:hypothetical protein RHMOL_Rhmol05G0311800 [Rhododendron molle]|uniref:Uncharacterized protein n=2 Tax=Rhododendron molle TaxID=49168 RepID=A0ACC0LK84_RHOML|nr:hypothetical protein RHMOL_Rhmol12G0158100 [Rhododendron molle]KAI8557132.1 hypothetical protein RHMOL_Rhmol05G0311800 [Rhododendron molle]